MNRLKLIAILGLLLGSGTAYAQLTGFNGFCEKGATPATVSGLNSTNTLQGVVPGGNAGCLVQVYLTGTTTPAVIKANAGGGTLSNPFRANQNGQWLFFANTGQGYDVVMSGGLAPNAYTTPLTLTDLFVGAGGGGGGCMPPSTATEIVYTSGGGNCTASPQFTFTIPTTGLNTGPTVTMTNGTETDAINSTAGFGLYVYSDVDGTGNLFNVTFSNPTDTHGITFFNHCGSTYCPGDAGAGLAPANYADPLVLLVQGADMWLVPGAHSGSLPNVHVLQLDADFGISFGPDTTAVSGSSMGTSQYTVVHVTGAATINTITGNSSFFGHSGQTQMVYLVADGAWSTGNSGNISSPPFTANVGDVYTAVYDGTHWYISQVGGGGGTSLCGPLSGDASSTNCGNGNFASYTPTVPANNQAYGFNNMANIGGTNRGFNLAIGNNSLAGTGGGNTGGDIIAIGDFAANPITPATTHDLIAIGNSPAENVSLGSAVCIGDAVCTPKDQTLANTLTGGTVVAIGEAALVNSTGNTAMSNIIAIGDCAGCDLNATSGTNTDLVIMGDGAGSDYTDAVHDIVALGNGAGSEQPSTYTPSTFAPVDLVAIGQGAGSENGGEDVVAIGQASAGRLATGSHDIVGVGNSDSNGAQTGSFPTTLYVVHDVVGIGDSSGNRNRGNEIIAIGDWSLGQTNCGAGFTGNTGDFNIAIGDHALAANGAGTHNVALGYFSGSNGWTDCNPGDAGNSNLTGNQNTWIGDNSGPTTTTQLSNTIALGFNAFVTASNQMVLGNSSITQVYLLGTGNGCLSSTGGLVTGSGVACGSGGGGSAFSAITGSTNTTATMVVGTGASLAFAGSGVVNASQINGITVTGTPSIGNVITATSPSAANWQPPGSAIFSSISSGTNTTAAMVVGAGASLNFTGGGTINASTLNGVSQLAVTKASVSHQFFTSYTSTTGLFTSAQPAFTDISGQTTLAQFPNASANSVLVGSGAAGTGTHYTEITLGSGLSMAGTVLSATGGGSLAFSSITSATNTTAAMLVGTGASLAPTGSGAITATALVALTGLPSQAASTVIGNANSISGSPTALSVPSCSGASNALTFTFSVGFGCNGAIQAVNIAGTITAGSNITITGSGTTGSPYNIAASGSLGVAWSNITAPSANLALTMAANTSTFTYNAATGSSDMWKITDTASNTGTGILLHITTASSSTEIPWQADANGCGWQVTATGLLKGVGTCSNQHGVVLPASSGGLPAPIASTAQIFTDSSGNLSASEAGVSAGAFSRICTVANTLCGGGGGTATLVASAEVVSFSATPTFSTAFSVSRIVLTGNITTFTLGAGADGQLKTLCFKQGSGPWTVTNPAGVHGFFAIGNTNGLWNCQAFAYDNTDSIWQATSLGVTNQ